MKINKQQIEVIVNSMIREFYDNNSYTEEAKKEAQKHLAKLKKTKFYKEVKDILSKDIICGVELWDHWISDAYPEFEKNTGDYYSTRFKNMDTLETVFLNYATWHLKKKLPPEWKVREALTLRLTLESIGADDIYTVLDNIKASVKKDFNL